MEFQATAKYLHVSTRKMRLVADSVRNLGVSESIVYMKHMTKHAASMLKKVFESAVSNALQKNISADRLLIDKIEVMEGPMMKRWRAVSRGRAHKYYKRMTHVRVILKEIETKSISQPKNKRLEEKPKKK